jgi:hypothetical protein
MHVLRSTTEQLRVAGATAETGTCQFPPDTNAERIMGKWHFPPGLSYMYIVACPLKARMVEAAETAVARERLCKSCDCHNREHETAEELQ